MALEEQGRPLGLTRAGGRKIDRRCLYGACQSSPAAFLPVAPAAAGPAGLGRSAPVSTDVKMKKTTQRSSLCVVFSVYLIRNRVFRHQGMGDRSRMIRPLAARGTTVRNSTLAVWDQPLKSKYQ